MVLNVDSLKGRITLSTKKLEATSGDMLRDPQLVFAHAEENAKVQEELRQKRSLRVQRGI